MKISRKMQEVRRAIRLHTNWLIYATLGKDALTKAEFEELEKYGKLPMDKSLELGDKSYLLGRLRALLKTKQYKEVTYEEVEEVAAKTKLSPVEELVLEQVRLKAGKGLKGLAQEISDGVYDHLATALGKTVTEAVIQDVIADEVAIAVIHKKTAQQLASDLASRLQNSYKRDWMMIARTELHSAKISGQAQAIANKVDIYAHSDGPNSKVSVVPSPTCCADCAEHYLDASGTPKIFTLADLMSAGSNSDPGVKHSKTKGIHVHWKTTLPPLHPNCGCKLVYVPAGYGWQSGKLSLLNKSLFESSLKKSSTLSATVKPKGPPRSEAPTAGAGAPSMPGVAAPGNAPGPGRPPGSGTSTATGGSSQQYTPCPFGGGTDCIAHGGNGASEHKTSGSVMRKHQEALARGAQPKTELAKEQQKQQLENQAEQFNAKDTAAQKVMDHLSSGKIGSIERRGGAEKGVNDSYIVFIVGNGSGLMKPPIDYSDYLRPQQKVGRSATQIKQLVDEMGAPGHGTIPQGMNPYCEAAAYQRAKSLGVNLVPVTTTRTHDGSHDGPVGLTSVQQFKDSAVMRRDYIPSEVRASSTNRYQTLVQSVPAEHRDKVKEQLSTIAVLDALWNNNDRHFNNLMMDSESHDVVAIDHGTAFGNGLAGHRNDVAFEMHRAGQTLVIPETLHTRLKNESLESTMRGSPGVPEWVQGQTFLRQKYFLHLQETHGHIPFEAIRGTMPTASDMSLPYIEQWRDGGSEEAGRAKFLKAVQNKELPHDRFEQWAKHWLREASNDPNHPDHQDAKTLMDIQPLRSVDHITGREVPLRGSLNEHFNSIGEYKPLDLTKQEALPEPTPPLRTPPSVTGDAATVRGPSRTAVTAKEEEPATARAVPRASEEPATRTARIRKHLILSNPHEAFPLDILTQE